MSANVKRSLNDLKIYIAVASATAILYFIRCCKRLWIPRMQIKAFQNF